MIKYSDIKIVSDQQLALFKEDSSLPRELLPLLPTNNPKHMLIQVCLTLNAENQRREVNGVHEAMKFFKMDKGIILTLNQRDKIRVDAGWIDVIPVYEILQSFSS